MHRNHKKPQRERGQSLTELALSMVVMLILLAGVADLGRAFFTYIALRDAAQEGALYGSFAFGEIQNPNPITLYPPGTVCGKIRTRVTQSSDSPVNLATDVNVTIEIGKGSPTPVWTTCSSTMTIQPCANDQIRVTVAHKGFTLATPFLGTLVGRQTIPISASIKDTILTPTSDLTSSCN